MEVIFTVNKNNSVSNVPISLSTALSQTSDAIEYFASLSPDEQQEIINYTHTIQPYQDIQEYPNKFAYFT